MSAIPGNGFFEAVFKADLRRPLRDALHLPAGKRITAAVASEDQREKAERNADLTPQEKKDEQKANGSNDIKPKRKAPTLRRPGEPPINPPDSPPDRP